MKCGISENDIALYVENDLPDARFHTIDAHLAICGPCRKIAAELRESQLDLRSLRQDMVDAAVLASVRARVLAEVRDVRSSTVWGRRLERFLFEGFRRRYVPASLAVLMGLGALLWHARGVPETPVVVAPVAAVVLPVSSPAAPAEVAPAPVIRRKARAQKPDVLVEEQEPMVVKLLTDDPNIVIYWLVDRTGGD